MFDTHPVPLPHTRRSFLLGSAAAAAGLALTSRSVVAALVPALPGRPEELPDERAEREAFLAAVIAGDLVAVRARLETRPRLVDAADAAGCSALVLAYCHGQQPVADALRERGARVELIEACMIPDWDRVKELAGGDGAGVDAWHPVGGTAMYAAARAGRADTYHLQDLGADPDGNPRGRSGVTPAWGALECRDPIDAWRCTVALLSNGAHVNAPQRHGETLLHAAARRGDVNILRYLLRRGADTEARTLHGVTALGEAERLGHEAAAAMLRNASSVERDDFTLRYAFDASGAPVIWPDLSDLSPAEMSAVTGPSHFNLEAVKTAVGSDTRRSFSVSTQDELAVEACGHTGYREAIAYHLDHGVPMSLATALSFGDLKRARALLERHPGSIHERGPHDFAIMWYPAIGGDSVEAAQLLLEHGADVNQDSQGTIALHWAAMRGRLELAAFLLDEGARIDAVSYSFDRAGRTPLQLALEREQDKLVTLLRERGAT